MGCKGHTQAAPGQVSPAGKGFVIGAQLQRSLLSLCPALPAPLVHASPLAAFGPHLPKGSGGVIFQKPEQRRAHCTYLTFKAFW